MSNSFSTGFMRVGIFISNIDRLSSRLATSIFSFMSIRQLVSVFFRFSIIATTIYTLNAQIILDNTLGASCPLDSPNFQITPDCGKLGPNGTNLFHSFSEFNLLTIDSVTQSATFSGPQGVQNILTRVTGNNSTMIDGSLISNIPGANFFFLNPNGVMFGPNAEVDISGSFTISTADYVRLSDGGRFDAKTPEMSSLTSASVDSFGFMDENPTSIKFNRSDVGINEGESLTLVGGDISISNGQLVVPGGDFNLVSVGSAGEVELENTIPGESNFDTESFSKLGDVTLAGDSSETSKISIDNANGGGELKIVSENLNLQGFRISAETTGDGNGGDINLFLEGELGMHQDSRIRAVTSGNMDGGNISITAGGKVTLEPDDGLSEFTGIAAVTQGFGNTGSSGNIEINAHEIIVTNGSVITADAACPSCLGKAGNVSLNAKAVQISNFSRVVADASNEDAGRITISGQYLDIFDGSLLDTSSNSGNAGQVFLDVEKKINISGSTEMPSAIFVQTAGSSSSPKAGKIQIGTNMLNLIGRAGLSTISTGANSGGNISITTKDIRLDGNGEQRFSGIFSGAESSSDNSNAGDIQIRTESLSVKNGASINASSFSLGDAGDISIMADKIVLDTARENTVAGIVSQSTSFNGGKSGNIRIERFSQTATTSLEIRNGASISSTTRGVRDGGDIFIDLDSISIDSGSANNLTGIDVQTMGIDEESGDSGDIRIFTNSLEIRKNGVISAHTSGPGDGGNIFIESNSIVLDASDSNKVEDIFVIEAISDNVPGVGNGGDIEIHTQSLDVIGGASITATSFGTAAAGDILIKASVVTLDGNGRNKLTDISSQSTNPQGGNSGSISIKPYQQNEPNSLFILDGAGISSTNNGIGNAGDIFVDANHIVIDRKNSNLLTGIDVQTLGDQLGSVVVGSIQLNTETLQILNGGTISALTNGARTGGNVTINSTEFMVIDGMNFDNGKAISSDINATTQGTIDQPGTGGNIILNSPTIQISNGGGISVSTFNDANAGSIQINTDELFVSGEGSHIRASSNGVISSGNGGGIFIRGGLFALQNGSSINSSTSNRGEGGTIQVDAKGFLLENGEISAQSFESGMAGNIKINAQQSLVTFDSKITTLSNKSNAGTITIGSEISIDFQKSQISAQAEIDGGNVSINAPRILNLKDSTISAAAGNDGGNITIDPDFVILNNSRITANAVLGNGGNIEIATDFLIQSDDSFITASSQFGLEGNIFLSDPELDLTGSLTPLIAEILNRESDLPEHCAIRLPGEQSSFIQTGKGGLPWTADVWQPSFEGDNADDENWSIAK